MTTIVRNPSPKTADDARAVLVAIARANKYRVGQRVTISGLTGKAAKYNTAPEEVAIVLEVVPEGVIVMGFEDGTVRVPAVNVHPLV